MAPLKQIQNTVTTRSKLTTDLKENKNKRKAESAINPKDAQKTKKLAFGEKNTNVSLLPKKRDGNLRKNTENIAPLTESKINKLLTVNNVKQNNIKSNDVDNKTDNTLYTTALEEPNNSVYMTAKTQHNLRSSRITNASKKLEESKETNKNNISIVADDIRNKLNLEGVTVPEGVVDFDKENWNDVFQVSHYAMDIFNYLKEREDSFIIPDYLDRQPSLSRSMRSLLVDWMVEIQESFELNHETLYLAVKLFDMYLSKQNVPKETLQLVATVALFIGSKFDERMPPLIDDFLYICDGAYTRNQLLRMERNVLKTCGFDLGIPLSYRFLRRYARCAKVTMPVLTLARFILEYSLMNYDTIKLRDSKLASAVLYMAVKMTKISDWTPTMEFYSGYKLDEFKDIVILLNDYLHLPAKSQLMTIKNKYSHKIFFEVAKIPLLDNEQF